MSRAWSRNSAAADDLAGVKADWPNRVTHNTEAPRVELAEVGHVSLFNACALQGWVPRAVGGTCTTYSSSAS